MGKQLTDPRDIARAAARAINSRITVDMEQVPETDAYVFDLTVQIAKVRVTGQAIGDREALVREIATAAAEGIVHLADELVATAATGVPR